MKGKKRSTLSGKIVNGKEVILTEEAVEYVKKLGYIVKAPTQVIMQNALMSIGLMLCSAIVIIGVIK